MLLEVQPAGGRPMSGEAYPARPAVDDGQDRRPCRPARRLRGRVDDRLRVDSTPMATLPAGAAAPAPLRDARPGISGVLPDDLAAWLAEPGTCRRTGPARSATRSGADDAVAFDDVRTLPAPLREALAAAFRFDTVDDTETRPSDGGLTEKGLHRLSDGALSNRC